MVIFSIAIVLLIGGTVYKGYLVTKEVKASIDNQSSILDVFRKELTDSQHTLEIFQENVTLEIEQKLHQVEEVTTTLLENFYNLHKEVLSTVETYTKNYEELAETGEHNKAILAELHKDIEKYRKDFKETREYVITATQKLEQHPETVKRELLKELKEHRKQITHLTQEGSSLRDKVSQENDYLFNELTKIKDSSPPKRGEGIRY